MFFAVLVSGLTLAIGIAIYDLVTRQLALSQTTAQSQYAFYMADTGAECALYWDFKCTQSSCVCINQDSSGNCTNGTAFATSTTSNPPGSGIVCDGFDVAQVGTRPSPLKLPQQQSNGWTAWNVIKNTVGNPPVATTTFEFTLPINGDTRCAQVKVGKYFADTGNGMQQHTIILSDGFSTCDLNSPSLVERELRIND